MGRFDNIAILTDLDGTFLADRAQMVDRNVEAIEYFKSEGGLFSLATGRMHFNIEETVKGVYDLVNAPAIMCNGTYFYDFGERRIFKESFMDKALVASAVEFVLGQGFYGFVRGCDPQGYIVDSVDKRGRDLLLSYGITSYVEIPYCEWNTENWYKLCFEDEASELVLIEGLLREKFPDVFEYNRSRPTLLELQMKGVNKSILIDTFKDYYRQKGKELTLYVCGDNENDIEMLKKADVSVCPANAIDAVKAISERCLCSNNEGLLADLIYSF